MNENTNKWLYFAWVVALVATGGSLFLSEVMGYEPCKLCWFQRIFMYPQVIILGIACYRHDVKISHYLLPINIIGGLFSVVHYSEQKLHLFTTICRSGIPCSGQYINWFHFITIPFLAFIAFLFISLSLFQGLRVSKLTRENGDGMK